MPIYFPSFFLQKRKHNKGWLYIPPNVPWSPQIPYLWCVVAGYYGIPPDWHASPLLEPAPAGHPGVCVSIYPGCCECRSLPGKLHSEKNKKRNVVWHTHSGEINKYIFCAFVIWCAKAFSLKIYCIAKFLPYFTHFSIIENKFKWISQH